MGFPIKVINEGDTAHIIIDQEIMPYQPPAELFNGIIERDGSVDLIAFETESGGNSEGTFIWRYITDHFRYKKDVSAHGTLTIP